MKFNLPASFTCTAHTGCMGTEQNTIEAIRKGVQAGADTVEFDLNFDKNNNPVLSHDAPKGGEVTLDEAFEEISKHSGITVNVDVKSVAALGKVIPLAEKHGILDRIFYTGISEKWVEAVRRDSKGVPYFLNVSVNIFLKNNSLYLGYLAKKVKNCGAIGINFNKKGATPKLTEIFRAKGLLVSIWTANTEEEMRKALACSPDNVTTRNPDILKTLLNK